MPSTLKVLLFPFPVCLGAFWKTKLYNGAAQVGGNAVTTTPAQCLGFLALGKHRLVELSVHSMALGDAGAAALAEGFKAGCFRDVQSIDLTEAGLTPAGCRVLASAMEQFPVPEIRELLLSRNCIGDEGVRFRNTS